MATVKKAYELDVIEVQWIRTALKTQESVLRRKLNTETLGSEIRVIRSKEIEAVAQLHDKF